MLQRSQMLVLPASGLGLGWLSSLFYARALGWALALTAGCCLKYCCA